MSKRYGSCPNPECKSTDIEVGWVLRNGEDGEPFMFCVACHLKGPVAKTRPEAERLWNLIPRPIVVREPARGGDAC